MIFWITAIALASAIAFLLALALLRSSDAGEHPAAFDLRVYRDQLKEVERDLSRGVISESDAERVRAEVGRRVLAADARLKAAKSGQSQPFFATAGLTTAVAAVIIGGGVGIYFLIGAPGKRDMPLQARYADAAEWRKNRPSQAKAEASQPPRVTPPGPVDPRFDKLMKQLRETVQQRPDSLQGQKLLARNEATLGNFKAAYTAQTNVIRLKGTKVTAADYVALADLYVSATSGYVSPEAESALKSALRLEPNNFVARYYTGLLLIQIGRPDQAFTMWDRLLRESPPRAPWVGPIRARMTELSKLAGVRYKLPPLEKTAEGSTAKTGAPTSKRDQLRSRVIALNSRLARQGGSAQEWSDLISGLGVLGEKQRAKAIWQEAQKKFTGRPKDLALIETGAIRGGLMPPRSGAQGGAKEPPALPGPTKDDIKSAATLSAKDRQAMIKGMVDRLSSRLNTEGGTAAEWARLITAKAALGNKPESRKAYQAALSAHKGDATALAVIEQAARKAGITE